MMPGQITDPKQILAFMFAGKATVTFRSLKTGERRTYKIKQAEPNQGETAKPDMYFVSLLNGPDNESSYVYMGVIVGRKFRTTRASKMDMNSVAVKALCWALENFSKSVLPDNLEVWHEGRCGRCGRKLTVPESIATGFGPECADRMELSTNEQVAKTPLDEKRTKPPKAVVQNVIPFREAVVTIQGVTAPLSQHAATAVACETLLADDLDNVPKLD